MKHFSKYALLSAALLQLTACQTTSATQPSMNTNNVDEAIERAAMTAAKGTGTAQLLMLEKDYKRNSSDPQTALKYATALRKENFQKRAQLVLAPFARQDKATAGVKTEMAAIELSLGNYDTAEDYAKKAILQDPEDYQAYQTLGIALDAKNMYPEAERAYRKGLEKWKGDPTSIMNNLALNLATQGFTDESIKILEKAKALAPDRIEIERNLRIVRTMNER